MSAAMPCGDLFCACGCGAWFGYCVRLRRSTPFEFEVTAPPLTGVFTLPPSILMPNDQDESRNALTTPAPPPSEPATNPENEAPVPRAAMNPPPNDQPKLNADGLVERPSTMPELLYNQLMKVYQDQNRRDSELFDPNGRFAQLQRAQHQELARELKEALGPRVSKLEETVAELKKQIDTVKAEMTKTREDYERKFRDQQACLDAVNETLADLEKARDGTARTPEAPPAG